MHTATVLKVHPEIRLDTVSSYLHHTTWLYELSPTKIITVNLSIKETEILWAVTAVRDMADSCFLLNFVGSSNIKQFTLERENLSPETLHKCQSEI